MKIPVSMNRASHVLVASVILLGLPLRAQEQHNPELPKAVDFTWGVRIPMRDGVKLNATVYRPKDQKEGLPVIFELTPYISDNYHSRAYYFAQRGYVFALVDVRG
ncbi:MAG: CocE/NonD family hydrolase, partial [Candidatus Sulfotelmatobacter sp.]